VGLADGSFGGGLGRGCSDTDALALVGFKDSDGLCSSGGGCFTAGSASDGPLGSSGAGVGSGEPLSPSGEPGQN
jgi:hypothetical protein